MAKIKITADHNEMLFCPFPKYKDWPWMDVLSEDPKYVEWLVSGKGPKMSDQLYDLLIELLEK